MFNIYDGPAYQDSNGYIKTKPIEMDCTPGQNGALSNCGGSKFLAGPLTGLPQAGGKCYMPQAAIGWKQPNGFYYPPAFHSNNLYFGAKNVPTARSHRFDSVQKVDARVLPLTVEIVEGDHALLFRTDRNVA